MLAAWIGVCLYVQPDEQYDRLGKTDSQILSLGREGWSDYYVSHHGFWKHADPIYAEAAKRRNERILGQPGMANAREKKRLARLLMQFADLACQVGYSADPNTGWGPRESALEAIGQDAIYAYLEPKGKKRVRSMVVSDVLKILKRAKRFQQNDLNEQSALKQTFQENLARLETTYREIVGLVSKTSNRPASDRVLWFCYQVAKQIEGDNTFDPVIND